MCPLRRRYVNNHSILCEELFPQWSGCDRTREHSFRRGAMQTSLYNFPAYSEPGESETCHFPWSVRSLGGSTECDPRAVPWAVRSFPGNVTVFTVHLDMSRGSPCSPSGASQAESMGLPVPWTSLCPTLPSPLQLVPQDKEPQSSDLGAPRPQSSRSRWSQAGLAHLASQRGEA